ncbi:probable ATP-dependent RNA helicase DHX34 [Ischnura elegans]|uniref:probable ATP-dependent RNA helicase DHX34 n=1 Tax=Ischnura elegans TaxID=197161 RepID=UPI001ED87FDD|nr:probable ATP-dependent RNA helicase DHX34 [Ischnura elegans]
MEPYHRSYDSPRPSTSRSHSRKETKDFLRDDCPQSSKHVNKNSESRTFSFLDYKHELNVVYFKNNSLIKYGTQEHTEFWQFLRKYESMQVKSATANACSKCDATVLSFLTSVSEIQSNLPPMDRESGRWLSKQNLATFQEILLLYLDFKQKEKFNKLKKLRKSQASLPVTQYRDEIIKAVNSNQIVIIAGDTGCGKSTQVPQYLLKAGYKNIVCTQPRRIACISLSKRVAYETLNEYDTTIGYQIRFEKSKTQHTRIVFVTEGLLLRQVSKDQNLSSYDVVVLDEVHERHLPGDFLLGLLKCLLYQRKDLKLVLMSATINIKLFQDYFSNDAVVIQVPGRLFPIRLNYLPISIEEKSSKSERINPAPYVRILQLINEKYPKNERGDVLIFLSGMSEISTVVEAAQIYAQQSQSWIIIPLHSTLSIEEQDKVFDYPPEGIRKCIVSTNIAETSITIDGIRFVVDSGKVKEMSYDPTTKMQRLKEFWISRASAEQRKGRAGRTGPGVCYRLYTEEEFNSLEPYSTPEIQRVPLDSLLLQMVSMGLPDARKFPFLEPPPAESIENSILTLKEQGALTSNEKLTTIGKVLSELPVDIAIGKMLIMGSLFHHVEPVLSLAAALSVQSPFTNRAYRDPDCETARKSLESDHGDPITLLNALKEWLEEKNRHGGNSRKWCKRRGLEEQRFYEMTKLRRQFKDLLQDSGLLEKCEGQDMSQASSGERAIRHGELKLLRSLKRAHDQSGPRKKKMLKLDLFNLEGSGVLEMEDKDSNEIDIKDVEFRLRNTSSQVHNLLMGSTACSYKDLMMLKVILCSGLYPQTAIADEFNYCKSAPEQLFHTRGKPYIALHPMSFFGTHPKVLHLEESDIHTSRGRNSKLPMSSKHQILVYLSLLETTKPYLMSPMRMPAAQTLLLFSQSMDTNSTFSRVVCDKWLEIEFLTKEAGEALLYKVIKLRSKWDRLLNLRLDDSLITAEDQLERQTSRKSSVQEAGELEYEVSQGIVQVMHAEVFYSIRRLLAADLKCMYIGPVESDDGLSGVQGIKNPFREDFECKPDPKKGGIQWTEYLTYNCLQDDSPEEEEEEPWKCPNCELSAHLNAVERLQHREMCKKSTSEEGESSVEIAASSRKSNSQAYQCPDCDGKTLYLTPIEILRHKKSHVPSKA